MPRGSNNGAKSNDALTRFVTRLEQLELNRRAACDDIAAVMAEAVEKGFNKKALRDIVKRKLESPEQETQRRVYEEAFDQMLAQLGMLAGTPLGDAALSGRVSESPPIN
jgi:uncharacterized protein (UPF0335 family)